MVISSKPSSLQDLYPTLEHYPLIVQPTLSIAEFLIQLQQLQMNEPCLQSNLHWLRDRPTPTPKTTHAHLHQAASLTRSQLHRSSDAVYALVMQNRYLLGVITLQAMNQIADLNGDLSQHSVAEVMQTSHHCLNASVDVVRCGLSGWMQNLWQRFAKPTAKESPHTAMPTLSTAPRRSPVAESTPTAISHYTSSLKSFAAHDQEAIHQNLADSYPVPLPQQSAHLYTVLEATAQQLQRLVQCDRVCVYRYQVDNSLTVEVEQAIPIYAGMQHERLCDTWLSSQQAMTYLRTGRPISLANLNQVHTGGASESACDCSQWGNIFCNGKSLQLFRKFHIQAKLAVPIRLQDGTLWGLLVAHECARTRAWKPSDIQLLEFMASHLSQAIDLVKLQRISRHLHHELDAQQEQHQRQLQQTLEFESMLQRIADRVRDSLDENQILQTAVQELAIVLGIDRCQTVICHPRRATSGELPPVCVAYPALSTDIRLCTTNVPMLCQQLYTGVHTQFCLLPDGNESEPTAVLICPIFDDQGYLGSLRLFAHSTHRFLERECRIVQHVASYCAIAIRQARLYQAAQAQVHELENLHQLKNDFLSTVSHELRTPLASIKMVTNLLKLSLAPANATAPMPPDQAANQKTMHYLRVLEEECDREICLVNDLLTTQHLKAGTHPLSLTEIDLRNWLPHIAESFQHRVNIQHQHLVIELANHLPAITSDTFLLSRVIVELLNNACKYTPPGDRITLTAHTCPDTVQIVVCNTGVEIPADRLSCIFDCFYRLPTDDPWKHNGTGLGLSLIKRLVEYIGGTIWAESAAQDVKFYVQLPLSPIELRDVVVEAERYAE